MSRVLSGALLAAIFVVPASMAQTSKALISGIVTDGSGAAVVGAKVTVTDSQRNLDYRTESNDSGLYRVIELTPGVYRVTVEAPGFRTYVLESLPLSTQQNASLNITLEVGAITERVQVTATGPLLEASSATLSSVVENKKIIDLPLNNRNIYSLLKLVPGITPSTPNQESDFFTSTIRFSINGGKESLNDIQLDGVTAMVQSDIQGIYGASAIPSVEGIQEFRVQTNSFTADYGRSGGGQVTMVTKSGSKDVLFGLYERRLVKSGSFAQYTVPTPEQLQGDFSNTRNANGTLRVIYDPFTTRDDPALAEPDVLEHRKIQIARPVFAQGGMRAAEIAERVVFGHSELRRVVPAVNRTIVESRTTPPGRCNWGSSCCSDAAAAHAYEPRIRGCIG